MGSNKDPRNFDKSQIVMARPLGKSISETARFGECLQIAYKGHASVKTGPWSIGKRLSGTPIHHLDGCVRHIPGKDGTRITVG